MPLRKTCKVVLLAAVMPWMGCLSKTQVRVPATPPPLEAPKNNALPHLLGIWQLSKGGVTKQMIFESGGEVHFSGGLDYFNPASWQLDEASGELKITFPKTSDEKLDIFHMYIGNGVKSFDRSKKEVTYAFDEGTWDLNIAGWTYSKPDAPAVPPEVEPVLK